MQAVILAAGRGTRLVPFTLARSKAMAPIVGKPMVERVLETIVSAGITDIIIVISPTDNDIRVHFAAYKKCSITFVLQKERLGMAHALSCTKKYIKDDFVLSSSDSLISAEFVKKLIKKYTSSSTAACLSLMKVSEEKVSKTGIVQFDKNNKVAKIIEKPALFEAPSNVASLPLYIFSKHILDYLDKVPLSQRGEYELQDAINMLIDKFGPIEGVATDFRYDLTSPQDLLSINLMFLKQMKDSVLLSKVNGSRIINPVYIGQNVTVGKNCTVGPNVYIESDCMIGENSIVHDSVLLKGTKLPEKSKIENEIKL